MARFAFLWSLVHLAGRLPARVLYVLAAAGATALWYASPSVRRITRSHMRHVLGPQASARDVDRAARGCVRTNAYYYADFARYSRLPPERLFEHIEDVTGLDSLFERFDRGQGLILISAHLGSPEMVTQAVAPVGICLAIVTEPLQPPRVHEYVHRMRSRRGMTFIPLDRSGLRASLEHLRNGGTLGLLMDRDVLGTAQPFPFFGGPARVPRGAVELARRTGAPIVAVWVPRVGVGRYAIHAEPVELPTPTGNREADIDSGMHAMVASLEGAIRRWPSQWFPLEPIWEVD